MNKSKLDASRMMDRSSGNYKVPGKSRLINDQSNHLTTASGGGGGDDHEEVKLRGSQIDKIMSLEEELRMLND